MDYEKKYKEALERAREWYNKTEPDSYTCIVESIFPELKESEDERIRKELITNCRNTRCVTEEGAERIAKWIAWLEKQGKKKSIDRLTPQEAMDIAVAKCFNEQEAVDKVEPKFHEGDWVIYKNDICKIVKRKEGCNKLVTVFGIEKELVNERNLSTARLWTIQDAKDGDVLVVNNEVFIYAHRKQMYYIAVAHCFVDSAGGFYLDGEFGYEEYGKTISPATKEQRELLWQKMKEAGYEWDDGKKELKKIGQSKVTDVSFPSFDEANGTPIVNFDNKEDDTTIAIKNEKAYRIGFSDGEANAKENIETWKPSEEQVKAFEHFVRSIGESGYASPYENNTKLLYSLLGQLKKL